jgi:hypothetical protein
VRLSAGVHKPSIRERRGSNPCQTTAGGTERVRFSSGNDAACIMAIDGTWLRACQLNGILSSLRLRCNRSCAAPAH